MDNLTKFFEVAIRLRNKYADLNDPHKDSKTVILAEISKEIFMYGQIPSSFKIQYSISITTPIINNTIRELFYLLSIEVETVKNDVIYTSNGRIFSCHVSLKTN